MVDVVESMTTNILFVGFTLLFLSFVMCCYFAYNERYGRRKFQYVSMTICGLASLAYLAMATKNGYLLRADDGRLFFYARYIDWVLTTPLLLYDIAAVAGIESGETFGIIGLDVLMIVAGLIGGTQTAEFRWLFWAFGMFTFVPIIYMLMNTFKIKAIEANTSDVYGKLMSITVITWVAYPVVWAIGEGSGVIDQKIEVLLYVILDVIAKGVFAFVLLNSRAEMDRAYDRIHGADI